MGMDNPAVAGAVGSAALGSHFGASLEDHSPNVVLTGQVHRLPDAPEAYGAMITRAKAAPAQSHSTARSPGVYYSATSAGVTRSRRNIFVAAACTVRPSMLVTRSS